MRLIDADRLLEELKTLPMMSNWGEVFIPELIRRQPTIPTKDTFGDSYTSDRTDYILERYTPMQPSDTAFDSSHCKHCPNNPINGGSGICHCILGQKEIYC